MILLAALLAPAVCLLWFMGAAMRNEGLATRQKLSDVYRSHLALSQRRLQQAWRDNTKALEQLAVSEPAPGAFARCVRSGLVDGALIFDEQASVRYPNSPAAVPGDFGELETKWAEACRTEYARKYAEAAGQFGELVRTVASDAAAARAFQAEVRCLAQAGQTEAAIRLVEELRPTDRYAQAADLQGRLIAANAELMALELITNRTSASFQSIAQRLADRLSDYGNPAMAAPQRRFLMKEVRRLTGGHLDFPTLAAEELSAEMAEQYHRPSSGPGGALGPGRGAMSAVGTSASLWQFTTRNQRLRGFIRSDKLLAVTRAALADDTVARDVTITLVPPDREAAEAFVTLPAGEEMPGWRLALAVKDREFFVATAGRQGGVICGPESWLWRGWGS